MSSDQEYASDDEGSIVSSTGTQTFLGYVDTPLDDEQPTIEDSFIGGTPVWLNGSGPDAELLKCKNCKANLKLLAQVFAPLETKSYDRVLYVFNCGQITCQRKGGSVRCIRGILKVDEEDVEKPLEAKLDEPKKFDIDFTKKTPSENPFSKPGENPFAQPSGNPFASPNPFAKPEASITPKVEKPSFAAIAAKTIPKKAPIKKGIIELESYPGYFIYVNEEVLARPAPINNKNIKLEEGVLDYEPEVASSSSAIAQDPTLSKIQASLEDAIFQNFNTIIQQNPTQVLRYSLGGRPLLYTTDIISKVFAKELRIPKPGYNPSSSRQFEFQLMPKMIMDLEVNQTNMLNSMEWGTIIIATDVEDYMPHFEEDGVGYIEEWCGVQWEQ